MYRSVRSIAKPTLIRTVALLPALFAQLSVAATPLLEEVVVTAQKRAQSLQQVPIAINAFTGDFLQVTGARTVADLEQFTPGLTVDSTSVTQPSFTIRGIGTTDFGIGTDPAVGVYVDGVYVGRSGGSLVQFTDIERVEVLKGPQGTLFGRNAAAGAIQIITRKPVDKTEGMVRARIGNYDERLGEGMFNTPLASNVFARFNYITDHRDGYIENALHGADLSNKNYDAARASIRWTPGTNTDIRYTLDYNRVRQQGPTAVGLNPQLSAAGGDPFGPVANDVVDSQETRDLYANSLHLEHDFGRTNLTWITSYRKFDTTNREDEDGVANFYTYLDTENIEHNRQFYQEIRFNGSNGPIDWVAGASYYHEQGKQSSIVTTTTNSLVYSVTRPVVPDAALCAFAASSFGISCGLYWSERVNNEADTKSSAVFADMTWSVTGRLDLTAGLRYTWDQKKFSWQNPPNSVTGNSADDQIFAPPNYPLALKDHWVSSNDDWTNLSPRAVIDYHWTEDLHTFLSYAKGYKAGGFNSVQPLSHFNAEHVENWELGLKSQWFDHRLRLNASGFYYRYTDKQDVVLQSIGTISAYVTRSGDAEGSGIDLEMTWVPTDALRLGLNYGYLHTNWTHYVVNIQGTDTNIKGEPLTGPNYRVALLMDYDWTIGNAGSLLFHIDYSHTDRIHFNQSDPDYFIAYKSRNSSRDLVDARFTWKLPGDHWQLALWGENLLDNNYVAGGVNTISANTFGTPYVRRAPPRLWGAEAIYSF